MVERIDRSGFFENDELIDRYNRLRAVLNQLSEAVAITTPGGVIEFVNPVFLTMYGCGRDEVENRTIFEFFDKKERVKKMQKAISNGKKWHGHLIGRKKDGSFLEIETRVSPIRDSSGKIIHVVGIQRDVSKEVRLEKQLNQAQKMEAIGSVAGGIAHEINNPAQFVKDNTLFVKESCRTLLDLVGHYRQSLDTLTMDTVNAGEQLRLLKEVEQKADIGFLLAELPQAIDDALDGIDRISNIVRAMKEFSHPGDGNRELVNVNKAIERAVLVSKGEWKYVADVRLDLDDKLPLIYCFLGEFNQVLLNIIINAAHAMDEKRQQDSAYIGTITIATKLRGNKVEVSIGDTGGGIPKKFQSRLFDSFFTTKSTGRGTGQGLAISKSIIEEKHGGRLGFETREGVGTTFIITLPVKKEKP